MDANYIVANAWSIGQQVFCLMNLTYMGITKEPDIIVDIKVNGKDSQHYLSDAYYYLSDAYYFDLNGTLYNRDNKAIGKVFPTMAELEAYELLQTRWENISQKVNKNIFHILDQNVVEFMENYFGINPKDI